MRNSERVFKKKMVEYLKSIVVEIFAEYTAPEIKNSEKNKKVGDAILALDNLLKE